MHCGQIGLWQTMHSSVASILECFAHMRTPLSSAGSSAVFAPPVFKRIRGAAAGGGGGGAATRTGAAIGTGAGAAEAGVIATPGGGGAISVAGAAAMETIPNC